MQNDSFKMRQHYAPYNRSEESHRVSEEYIFNDNKSIVRWDISLSLNMTYFLSPIVGIADTSPEGGSEVCFTCHCVNAERANLLARGCERRYS